MKTHIFSFLVLLVSSAAYAECVNVSGVFRAEDDTVRRIVQTECTSMTVQFGKITTANLVNWEKPILSVFLDGKSTCRFGACWTGSADKEHVEFTRDNTGITYDAQHGTCDFRTQSYAPIAAGGLVWRQDVLNCEDGFSGVLEKQLKPFQPAEFNFKNDSLGF